MLELDIPLLEQVNGRYKIQDMTGMSGKVPGMYGIA